jgi:hypothetical protein
VALLGVERQFRGMSRRAGIFEVLEERLRAGLYPNEQEAVAVLRERQRRLRSLDLVDGAGDREETEPPMNAEERG